MLGRNVYFDDTALVFNSRPSLTSFLDVKGIAGIAGKAAKGQCTCSEIHFIVINRVI